MTLTEKEKVERRIHDDLDDIDKILGNPFEVNLMLKDGDGNYLFPANMLAKLHPEGKFAQYYSGAGDRDEKRRISSGALSKVRADISKQPQPKRNDENNNNKYRGDTDHQNLKTAEEEDSKTSASGIISNVAATSAHAGGSPASAATQPQLANAIARLQQLQLTLDKEKETNRRLRRERDAARRDAAIAIANALKDVAIAEKKALEAENALKDETISKLHKELQKQKKEVTITAAAETQPQPVTASVKQEATITLTQPVIAIASVKQESSEDGNGATIEKNKDDTKNALNRGRHAERNSEGENDTVDLTKDDDTEKGTNSENAY